MILLLVLYKEERESGEAREKGKTTYDDNGGVHAQPARRLEDGLDDVAVGVDAEKVLGAALEDEVLFARVVDADDAVAHASLLVTSVSTSSHRARPGAKVAHTAAIWTPK